MASSGTTRTWVQGSAPRAAEDHPMLAAVCIGTFVKYSQPGSTTGNGALFTDVVVNMRYEDQAYQLVTGLGMVFQLDALHGRWKLKPESVPPGMVVPRDCEIELEDVPAAVRSRPHRRLLDAGSFSTVPASTPHEIITTDGSVPVSEDAVPKKLEPWNVARFV